ncbi:Acetyltransferase (GNAT) family protein [Halogranum amylolyticum]|uniref:Acetyltransferase (GNAT) family protein n=1 Tax=Halogranum amylolyticum TaxID=660520 RepID=A0A1H8R5G6_9EURY|nr:GNAT family N-acetyltransferase [Halogranum amylolyticum]SEO61586.1 Acetyltransferase (GNAT) family protein [Halogranum amylolyticum]
MDVRPAQSHADVRGAIEVNRTAWREAYADILPESTLPDPEAPLSAESVEGRFDDIENRAETTFLVACDGDETSDICGFAEFVWGDGTKEFVSEDAVELRAVYVDPTCWDEGVGTALLAAAADHLPSEKRSLVTETFAENEVARRFYEARGFDAVDEHAFDIDGESYPTVVYEKSL